MQGDDNVSITFKNYVQGESNLEKYVSQLKKIKSILAGIDKVTLDQLEKSIPTIDEISKETKETKKETDNLGNSMKKAFYIGTLSAAALSLRNIWQNMGKLTNKSASYLENMNLLDVAFNNNTESADKFVNKLSEMYGLDESWGYRTVGIFKQLANAMGLASEVGDKLSTTMTQFSIDIASLYNMDTNSAVSILQSALAGQTKPARRLGADITQTTLQTTLDTAGIDKYVTNLSYVEKRLLIVASLLQQVSEANNDWGRTIESVANQTRILSEQWNRFTRTLGDVFLPIMYKVLPYLNAFLMVLTEIVGLIASVVGGWLGVDTSDFDFFAEMDESVIEFTDDVGTATSSVKKLKQGLRGFDKLNVITTPSSGSAGGGAGSGGLDPAILDLFNKAADEYNSKLENVRMKANKIRDAILDWLGFTDGTYKNLKLIGITLGSIAGIGILKGLSKIATKLGLGALLKNIGGYLVEIFATIKKFGLKAFAESELGALLLKLKTIAPLVLKIGVAITSIVALVKGIKKISSAFEDVGNQSKKAKFQIEDMGKGLTLAVGGGAVIGTLIAPGIGTAIGAIAGALVSVTSAIVGYKKGLTELAKSELFGTLSLSTQEWTDILKENGPVINGISSQLETLKTSLNNSYSSFENSSNAVELLGLKFQKLGEGISGENGTNFLNSIQNMADSATQIISDSGDYTLTILNDIFANSSALTEEEEANILNKVVSSNEDKKKDIAEAQDNITKTYDNAIKTRGYLTDEEYNYIQEQLQKIRELTQQEMSKNQANIEYFKRVASDKNLQLDEESYSDFEKALEAYHEEAKDEIANWYNERYNELLKSRNNEYITEEEFNKQAADLTKQRVDKENEVTDYLEETRQSVFQGLADKYDELTGKTDKTSKDQRDIIANIFKGIDVDEKDIVAQFGSVGTNAGAACARNIEKELGKTKYKMKVSPTIPQQNELGLKTEYKIPMTIISNAKGGLPPVGQLFIANERGPELVGQIGGQSFVANQNQMMDLLDSKIGNSSNGIKNATFIIQVGNKEIAREVITDLQDIAKTNGKPITIGG